MIKLKAFFTLFALFLSVGASADLLGRIKIEEALKERLEHAIKIQDATAQVTVRIEYNKYQALEDLPGTNHTANKMYYAEKIENSDINKVYVQYFSEKPELTTEQSALIYSLVPLEKNRVNISFKSLPPSAPKPAPIEVKDLNNIADKSIELLSLMLGSAIAAACLIFGFALFFNDSKNRALFKQQFGNLISSVSNGSFGGTKSFESSPIQTSTAMTETLSDKKIFADYSSETLSALLADLYWCEKDQAAHFVWSHLTAAQKNDLFQKLEFMFEYSLYFSQQEASLAEVATEALVHPYYNKPLSLNQTSQEALLAQVKKNFSLWSKISPIRQQALPLTLKEKVKANGMAAVQSISEKFPVSQFRVLPRPIVFGDISFEDETEIFHDDKLIPSPLRPHVPSLVWLALKDKQFIEEKFEKLDAKYLASAWIAAPEILAQLEECLPPKKLQLLKSYLNNVKPSKSSPAFHSLFELGLEVSSQQHEILQKAS